MNPNQPNNFSPYFNQYRPEQLNSYQFINQQQFNQNVLNLPRNNFQQQGSLSPTQNYQVNRNKLDRVMYSSTIETTLPSKSFGIGKLQSMGRFVGRNDDFRNQTFKPSYEFHSSSNQIAGQKTLERPIQTNKSNQFDRFPSFNLNEKHLHQQTLISENPRPQSNHAQQQQPNQAETLTPEQKRRRQILAIKQELQMINKKMQSSNLNRKYSNEATSDLKPNLNSNTPSNINNNNSFNMPTNSSGLSTGPSYGSSNYDTGSTFTRNNQLGFGQRNKGLVTQSMIVSNEPSAGFKYQSIFDKYDSMKKPTYETIQNKDDRPSLLDQFLKKGTGSNFNKQTKIETLNFSTNSKSPNSQKDDKNTLSFTPTIKTNLPLSGSSQNYGISSNFNSTNLTANTSFSIGNINSDHKEESGMFKKKKFGDQPKMEFLGITQQTKSGIQGNLTFKKSPRKKQNEQNFVTNAVKELKTEELVDLKREDFIVGKKLGKGQFGEVMLVQHKKTGFICGMKVMQKKQIRDQKYEGQIARQLSVQFYLAHRNIAPLYGYFQDQKNVYLLVEYCTGGQLLQMLRKNRRMEEPEVSRIIKQIIQGIDYIHKELIIHRDIKPQNILFNFGVAKICDFGWAVYKGHGMRKTASVGSPLYYSPQIVMGVEYDQKIDIWDIGMMTYECLLGKIPFRIYSELDLNRIVQDEIKFPEYIDTTQEAKDFILRIMKKKPEERMEIREMLRHPFITKYQDQKLPVEIMKDFKEVLS